MEGTWIPTGTLGQDRLHRIRLQMTLQRKRSFRKERIISLSTTTTMEKGEVKKYEIYTWTMDNDTTGITLVLRFSYSTSYHLTFLSFPVPENPVVSGPLGWTTEDRRLIFSVYLMKVEFGHNQTKRLMNCWFFCRITVLNKNSKSDFRWGVRFPIHL